MQIWKYYKYFLGLKVFNTLTIFITYHNVYQYYMVTLSNVI